MPDRFKYPPSTLDKSDFLALYGGVYENSTQFAALLWPVTDGCINSPDALSRALQAMVDFSGREAQLALLRGYPDVAGQLNACTPQEMIELHDLGDRYGKKFGFPFIMSLRGFGCAQVLEALRVRLGSEEQAEITTALSEAHKIARLRLFDLAWEE